MKKFFSLMALMGGLLVSTSLSAQVFEEGGNIVHLGIGFGSPYSKVATGGKASSMPPVHVSFEHGYNDKIGIGGLIGYTSTSVAYNVPFFGEYKYKYSYFVIGARGTYHFINDEKLDVYGGAMLGYNVASAKYEGPSSPFITQPVAASSVAFGIFGGARYKFTDKLMVFGELGYSIAWLSVGIGYKL